MAEVRLTAQVTVTNGETNRRKAVRLAKEHVDKMIAGGRFTSRDFKVSDETKRLFTRYSQSGCGAGYWSFPWDVIYIEADKGVAEDVMKAFDIYPDQVICDEHESKWFSCEKNVEITAETFIKPTRYGDGTFRVICADEIPFFLSGAWKPTKWKRSFGG